MKRNKVLFMVLLVVILNQNLFSMAPSPSGSGAQQNPLVSFAPMILIFVIFYFLLIRPQQKKAKEQQRLLDGLKKNDKVVTASGIIGFIQNIKGSIVELKVDDNCKIQILRSAVSQILNQNDLAKEAIIPEVVSK